MIGMAAILFIAEQPNPKADVLHVPLTHIQCLVFCVGKLPLPLGNTLRVSTKLTVSLGASHERPVHTEVGDPGEVRYLTYPW